MSDSAEPLPPDDVAAQAAEWFARFRSGMMSGAERQDFDCWLSLPAHAEAFLEVERLWQGMAELQDDPKLLALQKRARRNARLRQFGSFGAIAASLLAMVALTVLLVRPAPTQKTPEGQELHFATATGQPLPLELADGSRVLLDANSAIRVVLNSKSRVVSLEQGRAYFQVGHDPYRPFVVKADGRSVTALGTAFTVDTHVNPLDVVLLEGSVGVEGSDHEGGHVVKMAAGSRLLISADGKWRVAQVDTSQAASWTSGKLVFDNTRLSDVVAEINRYTDKNILIMDDGTGEKRLSAVLKAGDIQAFIGAIALLDIAQVQMDADGNFIVGQK